MCACVCVCVFFFSTLSFGMMSYSANEHIVSALVPAFFLPSSRPVIVPPVRLS